MSTFEDHLWSHLVADHGADRLPAVSRAIPSGRRRPLLLGGTAAAAVVAIGAVTLALTAISATPPAYAVIDHRDGSATVTLRQISAIGALNARLAQLGIRARAVPVTTDCHAQDRLPLGYTNWKASLDYTVTVGNRWLPPGYTAIMAVKQTPAGSIDAAFGAVPSNVIPNCVPDNPLQITSAPNAG